MSEEREKRAEDMTEEDWKAATETLDRLAQERRQESNKGMNETIRRAFGKEGTK